MEFTLAAPEQSDSFNYVDPTSDHHKWKRKGLSLYYACVVDNTANTDGSGGVICALRAAVESNTNNNSKAPIFLIDYVYSHPSHRDKGIAGRLITKVLSMAKSNGATLGVLSIEETCVYWLEKHNFLLCQNSVLNERLNVFPDTHLLIHKDCKIDNSIITNGNESGSGIVGTNNNNTAATDEMIPPQTFVSSLKQLQIIGTTNPTGLSECLITLSKLIHNAKYDQSENYRRRTIRINNPIIHSKVMAFGGEFAMNLLQCCGFELSVNDDGDAILKFVDAYEYKWLDGAVAQLEYEGSR